MSSLEKRVKRSAEVAIDGFFNLNKPENITSAKALDILRRRFKIKKCGYIGTLDPIATGVLPLGFGQASKLFQYIDNVYKSYKGKLRLGEATTTYDITGDVTDKGSLTDLTEEKIRAVFEKYKGRINQMPPPYSAKKINGERAYKLARAGIKPELKPVKIDIKSLEIEKIDLPDISFGVTISKGGYIRSLSHDIGIDLGTFGFMSILERTKSGWFDIEDSILLDDIKTIDDLMANLIPIEKPLDKMNKAIVIDKAKILLSLGKRIDISSILDYHGLNNDSLVSVLDKKGKLIAIGEKVGEPIGSLPFSFIKSKKLIIQT